MQTATPPTLLFDLDGTLTDPMEGITRCIQYALERMGKPVPDQKELCAYIGPPLQKTFPVLLGSEDPAHAWEAIAHYRERFGSVGKFENTMFPEVPEVLAALRVRGHRLFVATSKPAVFATEILVHFGLVPFFERIYGSELTGERTDKTELVAYILGQEGLKAEECLMIGDRRHDVEGARHNGVACIGVLWGYGSPEELDEAGATAICEKMGDLPRVIISNYSSK